MGFFLLAFAVAIGLGVPKNHVTASPNNVVPKKRLYTVRLLLIERRAPEVTSQVIRVNNRNTGIMKINSIWNGNE